MAKDDDQKNPGSGDDPNNANDQMMLEQQERDPEEAAFAEQAIHEYATWVLSTFRENMETALDAFSAWAQSQADVAQLDNAAHFEQISEAFMGHLAQLTGGLDSPIGREIATQVQGAIDMAVRNEKQSSYFVNQLSRSARDISWFLRDNLHGVLSGQWDQLLDLAYEGSTDFIPVLHQFGLPVAEWNPADLTQKLQTTSQTYLATVPKKQEEAEKQAGEKEQEGEEKEAHQEDAEESKKQFEEEEDQKSVTV